MNRQVVVQMSRTPQWCKTTTNQKRSSTSNSKKKKPWPWTKLGVTRQLTFTEETKITMMKVILVMIRMSLNRLNAFKPLKLRKWRDSCRTWPMRKNTRKTIRKVVVIEKMKVKTPTPLQIMMVVILKESATNYLMMIIKSQARKADWVQRPYVNMLRIWIQSCWKRWSKKKHQTLIQCFSSCKIVCRLLTKELSLPLLLLSLNKTTYLFLKMLECILKWSRTSC